MQYRAVLLIQAQHLSGLFKFTKSDRHCDVYKKKTTLNYSYLPKIAISCVVSKTSMLERIKRMVPIDNMHDVEPGRLRLTVQYRDGVTYQFEVAIHLNDESVVRIKVSF